MSWSTPRVAILASGSGSTAEAFIRATQTGLVDAAVVVVICSKPPTKAAIFERVARLNKQYGLHIDSLTINGKTHPGGKVSRGQTDEESQAICDVLAKYRVDHVALMGYMRLVRGPLLTHYGWQPGTSIYQARMTNTHPGPLPETGDTYGVLTSQKVLDLGLPESRHTVHLVADGMDTGHILAEHPVEIYPNDTAADVFARVQVVEKASLPYALGTFLRQQHAYRTAQATQTVL